MKKLNFFATLLLVAISTSASLGQTISSGTGGPILPNTSTTNLNVGIGTTNPASALHLFTGSNLGMLPPNIILERNDSTNQAGIFTLGISSNGFATGLLGGGSAFFKLEDPFGNSPNRDMGFSTNGTAAQFVIKNNGFIGAGTELPTANFHSVGTARFESLPSSITNTDIITTDANGNLYTQNVATLFGSSSWNLNGNTANPSDFIGTINSADLKIKTNNIDRAIITSNGNMGIGTNSPTARLAVETTPGGLQTSIIGKGISTGVYAEATDMNGPLTDAGISGFGTIGYEAIGVHGKGNYLTSGGNGNIYGVVGTAGATNPINNVGVFGEAHNASGYNTGVFGLSRSTTGIYNTGVGGQVTLNTTAAWNRAISGFAPVASNHYAGYFDGNVEVQTGTVKVGSVATPVGYKLYVEQGILTEKVKVAVASSTAWADYVFATDYKLKPLSEVEKFIDENNHLPNIPSADELVKEGLDLGKMQALQMEKIEELTLYLIEMKKEIEVLKNENIVLKAQITKN